MTPFSGLENAPHPPRTTHTLEKLWVEVYGSKAHKYLFIHHRLATLLATLYVSQKKIAEDMQKH